MGELCGKLVDAFAMGRSDDGDFTRLKCAIDYMVQYGYKRSEDDKKQLRDLLEAVLIDGISVQSAMDESPGFKRVIVTVGERGFFALDYSYILFFRNTGNAVSRFVHTCRRANWTLRTKIRLRRRWSRSPKRFSHNDPLTALEIVYGTIKLKFEKGEICF